MAEQDSPTASSIIEPQTDTKVAPKRKREDDTDDEVDKVSPQIQKRIKYGQIIHEEPASFPIKYCLYDKYMSVNLELSPLPKYKKQKFEDLVNKIKYKCFMRDTDKLRREAKVMPLTRFEMEAAWYQLLYKCWKTKGVGGSKDDSEQFKFVTKLCNFDTAMKQRGDMQANEWWEQQKCKYPDLDCTYCHADYLANQMQNRVELWAALIKDGTDPYSVYPFNKNSTYNRMSKEEINFIKITYEASGLVENASTTVTSKKRDTLGVDEEASPLSLRPSPHGMDTEMGKSEWDEGNFSYS